MMATLAEKKINKALMKAKTKDYTGYPELGISELSMQPE